MTPVVLPDITAILPAAGIGSRMHCDCPKQYLAIGGKTLLEHAVDALLTQTSIRRVIVAVSAEDEYFDRLPLRDDSRVSRVIGGKTRAESVMAGLCGARGAEWVLVHDAARPCLHQEDLARLLSVAVHSAVGGILAAPVRDTMKRARPGGSAIDHTVNRQDLWHALTPQLFPLSLLKNCLARALAEGAVITDEASALEHCGYQPLLVPGRADNIKVTQPEDLALATFYFSRMAGDNPTRPR
ncbi:2-C-methyl-D-erythritol 4-phosphate cytidylyltransferase [Martelella alba]|uniref:2-C-methyl-D-erythritol 4-phosphate cytidylyltransferase n=1 Tax=Martelella alba TaxID=2590451 RepID=A0ABY2SWD9_9HYPH|nr:2-C-methyl-D-erythritol 4-phosphate cytidylyltransferase [Martelella alba]TKI08842.1 2-C-methyl-D-erythritol 4-phosphate cytidylyltransferase [Martelella alba]